MTQEVVMIDTKVESKPRFKELNPNVLYISAIALQTLLSNPDQNLPEIDRSDLKNASILEPSQQTELIDVGSTVVLEYIEDGEQETCTILSKLDHLTDNSFISYQSPIAQALLGHKVGEIVSYKVYGAPVHVRIVKILPGQF